jgi:hypothetical protein
VGTTPPEVLVAQVKDFFGGTFDVYKFIIIVTWVIVVSYLAYKATDE